MGTGGGASLVGWVAARTKGTKETVMTAGGCCNDRERPGNAATPPAEEPRVRRSQDEAERHEEAQETTRWEVLVGDRAEGGMRGSGADGTGGGHRDISSPTLTAGGLLVLKIGRAHV